MLGNSQNLDKPVHLAAPLPSSKISIIVGDLSAKGAGHWGGAVRPFLLAQVLKRLGCHIEILGFTDDLVTPPLPTDLVVKRFSQGIYPQFLGAASQLISQIEGDISYAYKTKASSFGMGLVARRRRPPILDIDGLGDDWEMIWHGGDRWRCCPQGKQLYRDLIKSDEALHQPDHPIYFQQMRQLTYRANGITAQVVAHEKTIKKALYRVGHFIMATNDIDKPAMTAEQVLRNCKGWNALARSFDLLRAPLFFTYSVFFKTPKWIAASLPMVIALAVMVYTLAQRYIQRALTPADRTIIYQRKRPPQMPALRWIMQSFQAIYRALLDQYLHIVNSNAECLKRLKFLGVP